MINHEVELNLLRTSVRRLWGVVLVMFCVIMGLAILPRHAVAVHADTIPSVITAKQFVVVDDAGNQSIVVGAVPGLNSQQLSAGADFRGLVVFTADHKQVASLGVGTPKPAAQGSEALDYSELFLQSEDGKSTQAYIRSFAGSTSSPSATRLHLSSKGLNASSAGTLDGVTVTDGSFLNVTGVGSAGGRGVTVASSVQAHINGSVGLQNCPPPSAVCGPLH